MLQSRRNLHPKEGYADLAQDIESYGRTMRLLASDPYILQNAEMGDNWERAANKLNGFEGFLREKDKDGRSNLEHILLAAQKTDPPAFGDYNEKFFDAMEMFGKKMDLKMDMAYLRKPLAQEGQPLTSDFLDAQLNATKSESVFHGKDSQQIIDLRVEIGALQRQLAGRDMKTALADPDVKGQLPDIYIAAKAYMQAKKDEAGKSDDPNYKVNKQVGNGMFPGGH